MEPWTPILIPDVPKLERPIPEAADAVVNAANAVRADAVIVAAMLNEIRGGWLWKLLTTPPKVQ